jgi:phage portal protein BeeE
MKRGFFKKVKAAYNAYTGRFTTLDADGFPVFSTKTASGLTMSPESSLYSTAVFACVNLLSSVIASIPLVLYREGNDGEVCEDKKNPLYCSWEEEN